MEDVVDKLQAIIEEQLSWLKDDISSSEFSNPQTPSPELLNEAQGLKKRHLYTP